VAETDLASGALVADTRAAGVVGAVTRAFRLGALELLAFVAVLVLYDALYNHVGLVAGTVHAGTQVRFDEWVGRGTAPTVWLQQHLWDGTHMRWWDVAALAVYSTHFFVLPLTAAALWLRRRMGEFRRLTWMYALLTTAGYLTYVAYPASAPWLAGTDGFLPPVTRLNYEYWERLGLPSIATGFSTSNLSAADFGAVPSLHAAYPMLLLLVFWNRGIALRCALAAYVTGMTFALMYLGEHFLIDVLLGWSYAVVTYGAMRAFATWHARRQRQAARPA
jgi:hypothetical protein